MLQCELWSCEMLNARLGTVQGARLKMVGPEDRVANLVRGLAEPQEGARGQGALRDQRSSRPGFRIAHSIGVALL